MFIIYIYNCNWTYYLSCRFAPLDGHSRVPLQNATKFVTATYDILTPVSCLVIDWSDNSTLETYGDVSVCNKRFPNALHMGAISSQQNLPHKYVSVTHVLSYTLNIKQNIRYCNVYQNIFSNARLYINVYYNGCIPEIMYLQYYNWIPKHIQVGNLIYCQPYI